MFLIDKLIFNRNTKLVNRCLAAEDRNERLELEIRVLINKGKAMGDLAEFIENELKLNEDMPNVKTV